MNNYREGPMSPLQMLKTIAGICKTNAKMNWDNTGQTPEDEFKFVANMIDEIAALWNKTKDPKRKEEWYELVKKLADRLAQE